MLQKWLIVHQLKGRNVQIVNKGECYASYKEHHKIK